MSNTGYIAYIIDVLSMIRGIKVRKMFGGYGIYKDGIFFALVIDDILYFKVGETNRSDYEASDSKPFTYAGKSGKLIAMSYWEVPDDVLENNNKLAQWVEKAVMAAQCAKNKVSTKRNAR